MKADTRSEIGNAIRDALRFFDSGSLRDRAEDLLGILGYQSERFEEDFDFGPNEFLDWVDTAAPDRRIAMRPRELIRETWDRIQMVFQYTDDELGRQAYLFDRRAWEKSRAKSFLFLAVDLKNGDHPRHKLAAMTRAINRPLMMPAIVFFRYRREDRSTALTIAVIHRRAHKRDAQSDVLDRATLIKDIRVTDPHRAHLDILMDLALGSLVLENRTFDALHRAWQGILDVEALNRRFYTRLFEWFEDTVATCSFPDDGTGEGNAERHVIRMITRLLFIWFLKEKRLVPEELFEESFADEHLNAHGPDTTDFYCAVLQNLFFATLNTPIDRREFRTESKATHFDFTKFRYRKRLKDPEGFKTRFDSVPFVNGGLFDCLDTFEKRGARSRRIDAFTDTDQGRDLHVPARVFFDTDRGLFPILGKYKFTVEENTPLDQEVALDPELLGKTFENLLAAYNPETREHARKKTGSYYTPRDVVDYMVQEALVEHLSRVVPPYDADEDWLKDRLRHLFAIDQGEGAFGGKRRRGRNPGCDDHLIHKREINPLIDAIDKLRVIDPACGSGAFLMGILHTLVKALARIDPRNERWKAHQMAAAKRIRDPAVRQNAICTVELAFAPERAFGDVGRKLYLIQRVIRGVDLQPIATQIAKLRFFISLIIEQPTTDDPEKNFGLEPLPNLETCFVAADTLKRLDRPDQQQLLSPHVSQLEEDLRDHRRNWFDAHDRDTKWELRKRDRLLRRMLREALLEDHWDESSACAIANWDAYDQNSRADWFEPEWMFGLTEGFDIVIGNPPYIQLKNNGGLLANRYQHEGYTTFVRSGDMYVLFYERGVGLLRSSTGILAYITSNSWLRALYGKKLRRLFAECHTPLRLLEMGKAVFENAIVDSAVLFVRKGEEARPLPAVDLERVPAEVSIPDPSDAIWGEVRPSGDALWSILSPREWAIMDKMLERGTPLREWNVSIRRGVLTGLNPAFIIDDEKRDELIAEDRKSAEIIKPILRGRDIRRWQAQPKKWLIATLPSLAIDIDEYPAVKTHLLSFGRERLEQIGKELSDGRKTRKKTAHSWFELQDFCAYYEQFSKNKLFWMDMAPEGRFAMSCGEVFCNNTGFIMTARRLSFLAAVLNSSAVTWLVSHAARTTGLGLIRWERHIVEQIPIPRLPPAQQSSLERVTDRILSALDTDRDADISALEAEVNCLVYDLYGLAKDEIRVVESAG